MARVEIKPTPIPLTELCSYHFTGVSKTKGNLNMDWETTRISVPIETASHEHTLAEIKKATEASRDYWYTYSAAAQYHFYQRKDAEKAVEYIDIAIALNAPNPAPWMLKSQILEFQEKYKEAIEQAEKALEVSRKLNFWFEIEENEEKIKEWKKKIK
ncbi:MAG: tetratricopeptide (TPR) repeat protein [Cyclobacteriaceae bacterium]